MSTDKRLVEDLNALVHRPRERRLPAAPARGALPPARGYAEASEPDESFTAGIASPLTEPDHQAREYYEGHVLTSSDGLLTLEVLPIQKLVMQDANQAEVVFEFAEPASAE